MAVEPGWVGIRSAADAIGLRAQTLLHCGPPASAPGGLVTPTLNSAAVACVFEGWAADLVQARELVSSGEVRFEPAQDHHVATPMAAVVSPSMQLIEMRDLHGIARAAYAPINGGGTGGDPAPRYGRCSTDALKWLQFLNRDVAEAMQIASEGHLPMAWLPLIDAALTEGDDAHLRHVAAHRRLLDVIIPRLTGRASAASATEFISKWPFFHLNFAMAAIRCILGGAEDEPGSGLVTALGGNGASFGLQVSGLPRRWFTVGATPPQGKVREPHGPDSGVGAYGDSALVEAFGLGALAQRFSPDMQALHEGFSPPDLHQLPVTLLMGAHPRMPCSGARVGLTVDAVMQAGATPVVELGIVDRAGEAGGLGAGIYRPPIGLFAAAAEALAGASQ